VLTLTSYTGNRLQDFFKKKKKTSAKYSGLIHSSVCCTTVTNSLITNLNGSIFTDAIGTEGWRCPACQNVAMKTPNLYTCFCGKIILFSAPHMMICLNLSNFVE